MTVLVCLFACLIYWIITKDKPKEPLTKDDDDFLNFIDDD